jgi:ABC-2 type transport system permease protein
LAGTLYFFMSLNVELLAFWIDKTWSLSLLLFFCTNFLGGATLPLSLLPPAVEKLLFYLPFSHLIYLPVQMFLGKVPLENWSESALLALFWTFFFMFTARRLFRRGCYQYAGVGT